MDLTREGTIKALKRWWWLLGISLYTLRWLIGHPLLSPFVMAEQVAAVQIHDTVQDHDIRALEIEQGVQKVQLMAVYAFMHDTINPKLDAVLAMGCLQFTEHDKYLLRTLQRINCADYRGHR